ncbi:MAG: hypothetical protein U5Q03_17525 [Bacteroidota bacterium]|nr:hypothetical protein [Bacteroidota bacterium]
MNLAEKVFANYPDKKHVLVILSDMIETAPEFSFSQVSRDTSNMKNYILKQERNNELPSLEGVKVYAFGPSASSETGFFTDTGISG